MQKAIKQETSRKPAETLERRPVAHSVSCDLGPWGLHLDGLDFCLSDIPTWSERFGSRRAARKAVDVSGLPPRFVERGTGFILWSVQSPFWCAWWTRPPLLGAQMLALVEICGGAVRKRSNSMGKRNPRLFWVVDKNKPKCATFWILLMHSWCNSDFDAFQHSVLTLW